MAVKIVNNIPKAIKVMSAKQEKAAKAVGQYVKDRAKLRAPVDTGRLRQDIDYDNIENGKVEIGNTVDYAIFQEKGTKNMTARPYLTPAAEENKSQIKDIVANIFKEIDNV